MRKLIAIIDYSNKLIQINIPKSNDCIMFYFNIITLIILQHLTQHNGYNLRYFQNILHNFGYILNQNDKLLIMLRTLLSDDKVIVLSYSQNSIRGYFHTEQPKNINK
jgi:hypothetical protein